MDEHQFIDFIENAELDDEQRIHAVSVFLDSYEPIIRKAAWAYRHYCSRSGRIPDPDFLHEHRAAWKDFFLSAARKRNMGAFNNYDSDFFKSKLLLCWHFPEYPQYVQAVAKARIITVLPKPVPWMRELDELGLTYHFHEQNNVHQLMRWMNENRPILIMVDYAYESTRNAVSSFLSYPAKTPVGLIDLAARFGYGAVIFSRKQGGFFDLGEELGRDCHDAVLRAVNGAIEQEILQSPARWLLWAGVDRRWVGCTYE